MFWNRITRNYFCKQFSLNIHKLVDIFPIIDLLTVDVLTGIIILCIFRVTGNAASLAMDYLPVWRERLIDPLVKKEAEGVRLVLPLQSINHI